MPITGPLPASLGNLTKLTYLDLSFRGNDMQYQGNINGSIPKELGNLVNLKYLNLSAQKLSGAIPKELGNLINIEYLNLGKPTCCGIGSTDKLTGGIPSSFTNLTKLVTLNLSNNLLSGTIPNLLGIPVSANVNIGDNKLTFAGMETNVSRLTSYSPQAKLPMSGYFPLSSSSGPGGMLFVEAGGTLANNTYKWFKNGVLVATNIGKNYFSAYEFATYRVEVTNTIATGLKLISDDYTVSSLPVTLISFLGKNNSNENILTWKTTSETNNSGFDIEKSADAKIFEKIGFVEGSGDSRENKTYSFTDQNPFSTTYYRLKQIDYDQKFEYSRIISLKRDLSGISIYPNPAGNQLFVKDLEKEENITMRNAAGQIILAQKLLPKQPVNTTHFFNGLYTITIGEETRKVVIQK